MPGRFAMIFWLVSRFFENQTHVNVYISIRLLDDRTNYIISWGFWAYLAYMEATSCDYAWWAALSFILIDLMLWDGDGVWCAGSSFLVLHLRTHESGVLWRFVGEVVGEVVWFYHHISNMFFLTLFFHFVRLGLVLFLPFLLLPSSLFSVLLCPSLLFWCFSLLLLFWCFSLLLLASSSLAFSLLLLFWFCIFPFVHSFLPTRIIFYLFFLLKPRLSARFSIAE